MTESLYFTWDDNSSKMGQGVFQDNGIVKDKGQGQGGTRVFQDKGIVKVRETEKERRSFIIQVVNWVRRSTDIRAWC